MVEAYKPLYTIKEVSLILKMNITSVNDLCNRGELPYLKLGSRKVRGIDLEKFINSYPEGEQRNEAI